jgi:hypothetical protein
VAQSSPARLYAGAAGTVLALAGIVGFFYSSDFGSPGDVEALFGVLDVNGWQNLFHILTGAAGLLAYSAGSLAARQYALAVGALYLVAGAWGFVAGPGDSILGIVPANTAADVFHALIGIAGLSAGLAGTSGMGAPA